MNHRIKRLINSLLFVVLMFNVVLGSGQDSVHFADDILRKKVCQQLGIEEPVTKKTILELTSLFDVGNAPIYKECSLWQSTESTAKSSNYRHLGW